LDNNEQNEKTERRPRKDYFQGAAGGATAQVERPRGGPMEVIVDTNIEKAMKILKRKLIKEGLFKELKSRRYFEKPSLKRKRKAKEAMKKVRKEESRAKKNSMLFS
jgi:small subunit ribosomal protein S21